MLKSDLGSCESLEVRRDAMVFPVCESRRTNCICLVREIRDVSIPRYSSISGDVRSAGSEIVCWDIGVWNQYKFSFQTNVYYLPVPSVPHRSTSILWIRHRFLNTKTTRNYSFISYSTRKPIPDYSYERFRSHGKTNSVPVSAITTTVTELYYFSERFNPFVFFLMTTHLSSIQFPSPLLFQFLLQTIYLHNIKKPHHFWILF